MTRLSVNINKIATLRNARGGNMPNVLAVAADCEKFGAEGITVHPRPDERHIRYNDVRELRQQITTEFNIEGYPIRKFIDLVLEVKPTQVTLVPDKPEQLTSNHGWNTKEEQSFLTEIVSEFKKAGIRTSLFVDPVLEYIDYAAKANADRIELYTGPYAESYSHNRELAIKPFISAAAHAKSIGLGVNAGHDLSLENLTYFHNCIPETDEVSIGHALICDALYLGLENTIHKYLECLKG